MKNKIVRLALFVFFTTISTGCAMAPTNLVDGSPIDANHGVLVVGLHSDWEGHDNPLLASLKLLYLGEGDAGLNYKNLTFKGKNHYAIIDLPARKYHFYRQDFGNRFLTIDETSEFFIKQNTITYIGDITSNIAISGFSVASTVFVEDRLEEAKSFLNEKYPKLLASYGLEKRLVQLKVKH